MQGKTIKLDEKELDQLVLTEFNRLERVAVIKRPRQGKTVEEAARSEQRVAAEQPVKSEEILTAEDEKFVADAVAWLSSRKNRDAIMAGIRERLKESGTEPYFTPGDEEISDEALSPESNGNETESRTEPTT